MPDNIRGENQSYSAISQALDVYFILEPHLMHLHLPEAVFPPIAWPRGYIQCSLLIGAQSLDKGFHQQCRLINFTHPSRSHSPKTASVTNSLGMRSSGPANLFASDLIVASSGKRSCSSLLLIIQSWSTVMAWHHLQYSNIIYIKISKGLLPHMVSREVLRVREKSPRSKMSGESPRLELVILILNPGKRSL
jgi:hypothetical protein